MIKILKLMNEATFINITTTSIAVDIIRGNDDKNYICSGRSFEDKDIIKLYQIVMKDYP